MLGVGGKVSSAKGMVRVPSLSGLSRAAAQSAIEAAGLVYGTSTDTVVNDSGLDDKIANQSILANTLVDYETVVSVTRYRFESSSVPPSYPPKPSDDGQIITGDCVISGGEISYPSNEAYCDGTTRVQPAYQVYRRTDKKVTYTEGPSYTWTRSEVNQTPVICNLVASSNVRTFNSSECLSCTTVVTSNYFSGANSQCASGFSNYRTDIYPTGCTPANKTVALGCITSAPTLTSTTYGDCVQAASGATSTAGLLCSSNGGGRQTRTRYYSDGSFVDDFVCCTYVVPQTCTPTVVEGAWSSCNGSGFNSGTRSRTVTTTSSNCSQTSITEYETCWNQYCEPYGPYSPACGAPGTQQSTSANCINSSGVIYTQSDTRCCTGTVITYGPCTGGIRKFQDKTVTTYYSSCTSSTTVTRQECLVAL